MRTPRTRPCALKRSRKSSAAERIASSRAPRGQVAFASSNSWKGRIGARIRAWRCTTSPVWSTCTRPTPTAPGRSRRSRATASAPAWTWCCSPTTTASTPRAWARRAGTGARCCWPATRSRRRCATTCSRSVSTRRSTGRASRRAGSPTPCATRAGSGSPPTPSPRHREPFRWLSSLGRSMLWEDLDCVDGIEVWSFVSDGGQNVEGWRDALQMITRPERYVTHPPRHNLDEWDRLAARRRVVGIGGLDAHQFGVRILGRALRLMSYHRSFRQLRTHVLVREPLDGDLEHDRALVFDALREGRCFICSHAVAPGRGFRLRGRWGGDGRRGCLRWSGAARVPSSVCRGAAAGGWQRGGEHGRPVARAPRRGAGRVSRGGLPRDVR